VTTKVCTKCGVEKALDDFHKQKAKPDNRRTQCKTCTAIYRKLQHKKKYVAKPRKKLSEEEKRKKKREYLIKWKENNPGYKAKWCKDNPEKIKLHEKNRQEKNRKLGINPSKQYRKNNKNKVAESEKRRKEKNIKNLTDNYIKAELTKKTRLKFKDIPPAMVELKRLQIAIHRQLLQKRKGKNHEQKKPEKQHATV